MNRFTFWVLVVSMMLCSCANGTTENNIERNEMAEKLMWKDHNRLIALVAAKYEVNEYHVKEMYLRYFSNNYPLEYIVLTRDKDALESIREPVESISKIIQWASESFEISNTTVAAILYDFEVLLSIHKIAKNQHQW